MHTIASPFRSVSTISILSYILFQRQLTSMPSSAFLELIIKEVTVLEHFLFSIWIQADHIATVPKRQRRDKFKHVRQLLHGGELPVVAVATAAHGPGDEGARHMQPTPLEDNGHEASAVPEREGAGADQSIWGVCVFECV